MDAEPIAVPLTPAPAKRRSLGYVAAAVPVVGGIIMWLVTGSLFALCFAALGPLMLIASAVDGARSRRREDRDNAEADARAWERAEDELERRQHDERRERWRTSPDALRTLHEPPLVLAPEVSQATVIVLGAGQRPSGIRTSRCDDDRARAFQQRAALLDDAPVTAALGGGIAVRGPRAVTAAVVRALVAQLCLRSGPQALQLSGSDLVPLGLDRLPHTRRGQRAGWRLVVGEGEGDSRIVQLAEHEEPPRGLSAVVTVTEPGHAQLRTEAGTEQIAVECLSMDQLHSLAEHLAHGTEQLAEIPDAVALADLPTTPRAHSLAVALGRTESDALSVDLVGEGPHAIVTGVTGAGKSELLLSWVLAMAQTYSPQTVAFVLADFKGGTAFDPLIDLPHVAAIMTDLDDAGARRGVASLTAELRRREAVLAEAGARDIRDDRVDLPRLVIVVDEFAALLQEHGDLAAVFTDIAARGRALGMHLILGTQRATGVIRDALAANCPLRVSLRMNDAADSRLVIGSDEAAQLPGDSASRGLALVRRPQDAAAQLIRVARSAARDIASAADRWAGQERATSPWLPALPTLLPAAELDEAVDGALVLGRGDEPERQQQPPVLLVPGHGSLAIVGNSGSGRTSALRLLASQQVPVQWIPADREAAWDAVRACDEVPARAGSVILIDDVDALIAGMGTEHAGVVAECVERIIRAGTVHGYSVVVTAARATGPVMRILDACGKRLILRTATRMEHLAAGGESDGFEAARLPGRGRLDGREVQIAWAPPGRGPDGVPMVPAWEPQRAVAGVICRGVRRTAEALRAVTAGSHDVVVLTDPTPPAVTPGASVIYCADAETWQAQWGLWQSVRRDGEVVVLSDCAPALRTLVGYRELAPYAHEHRGRAWLITDGDQPRRVRIAPLEPV